MSGSADSAEDALDPLLVTLQRRDLSPLDYRMLLWLAYRVDTQSELVDALDVSRATIGRAATRLSTRALIRRRFDRGRRSRFVLTITSTGRGPAGRLDHERASHSQRRRMARTERKNDRS